MVHLDSLTYHQTTAPTDIGGYRPFSIQFDRWTRTYIRFYQLFIAINYQASIVFEGSNIRTSNSYFFSMMMTFDRENGNSMIPAALNTLHRAHRLVFVLSTPGQKSQRRKDDKIVLNHWLQEVSTNLHKNRQSINLAAFCQ